MSVITPKQTSRSWLPSRSEPSVALYLSDSEQSAPGLVGNRAAGFVLTQNVLGNADVIPTDEINSAAAAIIQVERDDPQSIARFESLAARARVPLVAAAWDPPLAFVRRLVRAGAHDVVPLPLEQAELETTLNALRSQMVSVHDDHSAGLGKVVSIIKSAGGVGATSAMTQVAIRYAEHEAAAGRQACLIDLDIQFGDAAFLLGLRSGFSIRDLADAGSRLDRDLFQSTIVGHPSGLKVVASPPEVVPLESMNSDQLLRVVDLAARDFSTVFLDLPANWTNWSLSMVARSDLVLLFVDLSVPSLARAKRQLDLLADQDLGQLDIKVVVNRYDKGLLRTITADDVRSTLGRDIAFTLANDQDLMRVATDQGIPISEVKRRSTLGKDIDQLDSGIAGSLGLER